MTLHHIAVIEDDPFTQKVIEAALTRLRDYRLSLYRTAAAALSGLPEDVPDLILLDLTLSQDADDTEDGQALLQALRHALARRTPPVILATARRRVQWGDFAPLGVIGLIEKPFEPMALPSVIETIWGNHHGDRGE